VRYFRAMSDTPNSTPIARFVLIALALVGVVAIALLVLGLLNVHAVTNQVRIHQESWANLGDPIMGGVVAFVPEHCGKRRRACIQSDADFGSGAGSAGRRPAAV
jgi:hypothetical protein